jgi:hypothetical protein
MLKLALFVNQASNAQILEVPLARHVQLENTQTPVLLIACLALWVKAVEMLSQVIQDFK